MFSSMIEEIGAKFDRLQKVNGTDKFADETDLHTFSTYYPPIKGLTKKKYRSKLRHARKEFKTQ